MKNITYIKRMFSKSLEVLQDTKAQDAIEKNSSYNKAIFESETEKLIYKVINLTPHLSPNQIELNKEIQQELLKART